MWSVETLVECLRCGQQRSFASGPGRHEEAGECPRCHYVGWAYVEDVTEGLRRRLRDRPPEYRTLRAIHQA